MHNKSEKIRNRAFWLSDTLRGSMIRSHLSAISAVMQCSAESVFNQPINRNVSLLLDHATHTTRFYSNYRGKPIHAFPVIDKSVIRGSSEEFMSSAFTTGKLYSAVTSGSTGTPFKVYQDRNKRQRNYADTLYFAGLAGYEPGQRLIYLKIWVRERMKTSLAFRFHNMIPIDVLHFNDREIEELMGNIENDRSTFSLLGYASALELICRYLDRIGHGPVRADVRSVIAISEALNDYTHQSIEKYFGVPAVSRYSNLENGIIAQQLAGEASGRFLLNTASYFIEILKMDSDEPAGEGETGRIIVTDLFNYAMPMIRYDTGDIGSMIKDDLNPGRKYLASVEGRKLDLLHDTKGDLVSSYIVYKNMWQYTEIDQYQLIQEGAKQYTFKINCRGSFTRADQLTGEFKTYLGQDADFRIEYVSEIPLLSSGKRKKIVNNYIKS